MGTFLDTVNRVDAKTVYQEECGSHWNETWNVNLYEQMFYKLILLFINNVCCQDQESKCCN